MVTLAADGAEALRHVRDAPPDLVVLDATMPGLDGLEVLRRLRAADDRLPVVMPTARDAVPDRVAGLAAGDDAIVKPFAFDELLARIRGRLRRRDPGDETEIRFADLRLATAPGGTVTLDLLRRDDEAVLRVRDTGPGIAPEHLDRIFERFHPVDQPRSRAAGGTGIGLTTIARDVAESYGGRMDVGGHPGVGATFTLVLPIPAPTAAVPAPPTHVPTGPAAQPLIAPQRPLAWAEAAPRTLLSGRRDRPDRNGRRASEPVRIRGAARGNDDRTRPDVGSVAERERR